MRYLKAVYYISFEGFHKRHGWVFKNLELNIKKRKSNFSKQNLTFKFNVMKLYMKEKCFLFLNKKKKNPFNLKLFQ